MNLTCPSCDTTFRVDPGQIGSAGRRVRCGSCGHDWDQAEPQEDAAPPAEEPPPTEEIPPAEEPPPAAPEAARRQGAKRRRAEPPSASGRRIVAGWALFLLVAGGLGAGAYFGRVQIVEALPAAAELYRLAGVPVVPPAGEGLELRDVKSVRRIIEGQRVVVIEGTITNISGAPREVPQLRASVTDETGAQVDEWFFSADSASLPPGGETQFETSTGNAPREGNLGIDFVASR